MIAQYIINYLLLAWQIFIRPWQSAETLWIVLPLILILILIHVYFGRYPTEEIGWGTAFSNTISLLWVCIILFRYLLVRHSLAEIFSYPSLTESFFVVLILTGWVLLVLFLNLYHAIPKGFMRLISSFDFVYILAYISISLVIGFDINKHVLIAAGILFILMIFMMQIIKTSIPKSAQAKRIEAIRKKRAKRKRTAKKAVRTRKLNEFMNKIKHFFQK